MAETKEIAYEANGTTHRLIEGTIVVHLYFNNPEHNHVAGVEEPFGPGLGAQAVKLFNDPEALIYFSGLPISTDGKTLEETLDLVESAYGEAKVIFDHDAPDYIAAKNPIAARMARYGKMATEIAQNSPDTFPEEWIT